MTRMSGAKNIYQKIYDEIKNYDETHFFHLSWALTDAPYHGWDGDKLLNEKELYDNVKKKYNEFKIALEEALGIE